MEQEYNGYRCENEAKLKRAIYGVEKNGIMVGGVGEDAKPEEILGEYDRIGGYITKDGFKVQNGAFCDIHATKLKTLANGGKVELVLKKDPEIILEVRGVDGVLYEIEEGAELPLQVQLLKEEVEDGGKKKKKVRVKRKAKKNEGSDKKESDEVATK